MRMRRNRLDLDYTLTESFLFISILRRPTWCCQLFAHWGRTARDRLSLMSRPAKQHARRL